MRRSSPMVYKDGTRRWLLRGCLHRKDGPALEWNDGDKEWWAYGNFGFPPRRPRDPEDFARRQA